MGSITLHNDSNTSATYVSNNFIDFYMTAANGEYVKIYLYLLRCMNASDCSFSLSAAADRFEHTEKDIQRALKYWEKMKLLRLEYDENKKLSGIRLLNSDAPAKNTAKDSEATIASIQSATSGTTVASAQSAASDATVASTEPVKRSYTAAELKSFQEKDDVSELLFVTEHYMKRPLTPTDIQTILFWYDGLGLSVELIEYLIEYCISKGHTSMRYMDKVAMGWKNEGINSVERAKRTSSGFSQMHFAIMKALGITGRNLVASEVSYIDKWSKSYGFTQDIMEEACRRTISAIHQPSFEYTDKILDSWHKQNVHHLTDVAKLDSNYQNSKKAATTTNKATTPNRFHNFNQRTYDYDQLEQQLLASCSSQEVTCR